ncbi:Imidazolonepropionase [Piscirickettsia salmonis]|uniref:imidazolonepropionase n=1 Tax=Piscirickettsia salmonis TaxID=1238 RepID=UPI0018ACAFDF|nr:imidazolonepropionase [Piscirickettsia salmonis]QGP49645.1 Imidazolonepropionase [Piscirickettsia salmonis]
MKWQQVWKNVNLVTMTGNDFGLIHQGAIAVKEGNIAWLGRAGDLDSRYIGIDTQVHNGQGRYLTPGLIDCHTHMVYGGNRANEFSERLSGKTYQQIAEHGGGIWSTVQATRKAHEVSLFELAERRLAHWIAQGVTSCEIKSGYGLAFQEEKKILNVIAALKNKLPIDIQATFLGAHCVPKDFTGTNIDYINSVCHMLTHFHQQGLVDAVDGFCENIAFSREEIELLFNKAKELNIPVKLHTEQFSDQGGSKIAAGFNALSVDHLEYLNPNALEGLKKAGSIAVLLPGAYYYLQEKQVPDVMALREANIAMAVATDFNPGSSPVMSLPLAMNFSCNFFGLTVLEAFQGVTVHAAKALGMADRVGQLKVGMQADFALWEIENIVDLVYYTGINFCQQTVKKGYVIYP